ncbi:PD40 domain-containing protein [Flagellimonas allohymeniacidonis]|uniref:WD40-like Beta Propeller Repeat n=1 Tax=Flagellimonas allohymeniacidonis TaxID=2517819 RepID=A0A4Q8QFT3_9FLAO|nr:PD40 domain-containing protein [Allomuricauda hymeniacidonis]TAI47423.1 hypothetical protein EW142_12180 [Allomuricauda hymeniacidonis]
MKQNSIFSYLSTLLLLVFFVVGCKQTETRVEKEEPFAVKGPYFGIVPTEEPQLLVPELLASPVTEYNGTFSPDGAEFYFTTSPPGQGYITFTELQADSTWSEPKIASFSGTYTDYDPFFSLDGNRIYFSSRRPEGDIENSGVWYVQRENTGWSNPIYVELMGAEKDEYYTSLSKNGNLYFNTWSNGMMYRGVPTDSIYQVEPLPQIINEGSNKGDPFISPNEDYLIFRGYDDTLGSGDLYISFNMDGNWTKPENLGGPINSSAHEMCPWVSPDGKLFIFASGRISQELETLPLDSIKKVHERYRSFDNGQLNLYYMSASFIEEMKQKHLQ